jgi:hypothetical protein
LSTCVRRIAASLTLCTASIPVSSTDIIACFWYRADHLAHWMGQKEPPT